MQVSLGWHKILVAEGDSWFQFVGRDVINGLDDSDKNDLVGENRLTIMICVHPHDFLPVKRTCYISRPGCLPGAG